MNRVAESGQQDHAPTLQRTVVQLARPLQGHTAGAVLVLPGVPGFRPGSLEDQAGGPVYPSVTTDIMKLLRERGIEITYADPEPHEHVSHKAADFWMPVLLFGEGALANAAGNLLSAAIVSLLGRRRATRPVLHVKVGRVLTPSGEVEWLEANGPGEDVLAALSLFND